MVCCKRSRAAMVLSSASLYHAEGGFSSGIEQVLQFNRKKLIKGNNSQTGKAVAAVAIWGMGVYNEDISGGCKKYRRKETVKGKRDQPKNCGQRREPT